MTEARSRIPTQWAVGQSICLELDTALSLFRGSMPTDRMPTDIQRLLDHTPDDWRAQLATFFSDGSHAVSVLEHLSWLADTLFEADYTTATVAIRDLTLSDALERLTGHAEPLGIEPDHTMTPPEQFVDMLFRTRRAAFERVGMEHIRQRGALREVRQTALIPRILRDGDLHTRFWHWLDRFFYESYAPWRNGRAEMLAEAEARAVAELGDRIGDQPPPTAWLPPQNPLLRYPELLKAFQSGQLRVYFWAEPFGFADSWLLLPELLVLAFAEPGPIYENFRAFATDLANRAHALSDPTRLIILRMIRHFSVINTEMATFLGLARPTVSIHAKILREAGLIESHEDGRAVRHELRPDQVRRLLRDLEQFLDLPDDDA